MRRFAVGSNWIAFAVAVLLAGCVTASPGVRSHKLTGPEAFARLRDSLEGAREDAGNRAPRVYLSVPAFLSMSDRYVDASVRVSEDAYVLVAAVDLDGRVRVVFPESPADAGFVSAEQPHKLPRFFIGFGTNGFARFTRFSPMTSTVSRRGGQGILFAIASDRPLQFARLADENGEWDEYEIERMVLDRGIRAAGYQIASRLVLTGQDVNLDVSGFQRDNALQRFAVTAGGTYCGLTSYYFSGLEEYRAPVTYFVRGNTLFLRYYVDDGCGGGSAYDVPIREVPPQLPRQKPVTPKDSLADSTKKAPTGTPGVEVPGTAQPANQRVRFTTAMLDELAPGRRPAERHRIEGAGGQLRDAPVPVVEAGLRFRPPEQLRSEPRNTDRGEASLKPARENNGVDRREHIDRTPQRESVDRTTRPEAQRSEPVRSEPVRSEPVRSEPVRSEPVRSEPVRSEPVRSEPSYSPPAPAPAPSGSNEGQKPVRPDR